ncbi:hypothetical protein OGAPHI_005450 [Ogataea philodendri]|uniref:Uncharacterized protein n=1 Tax=Ogataea philodendri TaxID=1378263 RepID=A0A9P8NZR3_9ASCO|nr:uncharacterized protein OGAPHI_005450 [Ogataea philodendri]KAH3662202.1 hypothetical protein OGAPHI_005450 [Ogataea philodendri]
MVRIAVSHDKYVLSVAKYTFGSTLTTTDIFLPGGAVNLVSKTVPSGTLLNELSGLVKFLYHETTFPYRVVSSGSESSSILLSFSLNETAPIWEPFHILGWQTWERIVHTNVHSSPVAMSSVDTVEIVLAHHRELRIERNSHSGIPGKLESCSVVERSHHRSELVLDDSVLNLLGQSLELGQIHNQRVVVVLVECFCVESGLENRLEDELGEFIVLLQNLLKPNVIESGELVEIVHIGNDITKLFFQVLEILLVELGLFLGGIFRVLHGVVDQRLHLLHSS